MIRLYQDPEGKHIFSQENPAGNVVHISTALAHNTAVGAKGDSERGTRFLSSGRMEGSITVPTVYIYIFILITLYIKLNYIWYISIRYIII